MNTGHFGQELSRAGRRWLALSLLAASLVLGGLGSTSAWRLAEPSAPTAGPWSWRQVADVPQARSEAQGAVVNGKLYVIGGFYNSAIQATKYVDVYDPTSNTWRRISDMPEAITHAPTVVVDQTIYVLGGYVGDNPGGSTNHVWKLNTAASPPSWSRGPDMPAGRGGAGAALLGRRIHFFGGATRTAGQFNDTDRSDHYVLNLDTGVWSTAAALPNPRNHIGGVGLNGKVYAIGGQHNRDEQGSNQTEVDVYDPASNTWGRAADLPEGRGHITSSTIPFNGRILVIGGTINGGTNGIASDAVLAYDPASNVWLKMTSIPGIRKTPVADLIGDQIIVSTGAGYGVTDDTWMATWPDSWETAAAMPTVLGEVAGGIISNKLYLLGESSSATLAYDLSRNTWSSGAAQRPFPGNHHTAEVINGKLYLFGGLGSGQGKVQIFNPATNQWSLGADMPFAAGSSSSALIGGQVYVAGGIVGFSTTNRVARYNPASNTWAELAPMPQGRNHAAAATDGSKLYLFGGRGPGSGDGNTVANGFNTVQIYDPATNSWRSSASAGSTLAPLPQARGGMGRAVYYNSEFYIFGGETLDGGGATATHVYNRVDIYHPDSNTWRRGAAMPTARHGIFPLLIGQRIYVAGGGSSAGGGSNTSKLEVYNPAPYRQYIPLVTNTPAATARPADGPFQESGGRVVVEAENAQATVSRGGFSWTRRSDIAGYAGAGAMVAEPAGSTVIDSGYATSSPELRFSIQFATAGTYYVWARAWAADGSANSLHSGLDGATSAEADRLSTSTFGAWTWFRTTLDGADARLTVGAAGEHTLNIWMREDGLRLDRLLLTTDASFIPSGAGPAESPRAGATPTPTGGPVATPTATSGSPTATAGGSTVRINAGGSGQSVDGIQWAACSSASACQGWVSGGFAYTQSPLPAISGSVAPANQAIYQTEWTGGQSNGVPAGELAFRFDIPVSAGAYLVRLHFAELNKYSAGARVFDVQLEGATVLSQFDIWAEAGGVNRAIVREFPLTVSDGAVTIDFIRRVENAKISAIEVIPATP